MQVFFCLFVFHRTLNESEFFPRTCAHACYAQ
nr:MAG TPA: hypothetical protein [Caudoviricetes sp.]